MVEKEAQRLSSAAEEILRNVGKVSPGFLASDSSLPEENIPLVLNEELGILYLAVEELGDERGTLISDGIEKLKELFPRQENQLRKKVAEMVDKHQWITKEEVPDWILTDAQEVKQKDDF